MPQILELTQLAQPHRVPQMEVGRRRVESLLDDQGTILRHCAFQLPLQFLQGEDLLGAALDDVQLLLYGQHGQASALAQVMEWPYATHGTRR